MAIDQRATLDRKNFLADRWGHNGFYEPTYSRVIYMAHAKGYVMARRPRCTPFVISEKLWRSFDLFRNQDGN